METARRARQMKSDLEIARATSLQPLGPCFGIKAAAPARGG